MGDEPKKTREEAIAEMMARPEPSEAEAFKAVFEAAKQGISPAELMARELKKFDERYPE
jgi:hypothetical protein